MLKKIIIESSFQGITIIMLTFRKFGNRLTKKSKKKTQWLLRKTSKIKLIIR